jgi:hypothetical protein
LRKKERQKDRKKEKINKEKENEKIKGRNGQGFFSQGRHALLAVPCLDFPRC